METGIAIGLGIVAIALGVTSINLYENNQELRIENHAHQAEIRGLRDGVNMSRDN